MDVEKMRKEYAASLQKKVDQLITNLEATHKRKLEELKRSHADAVAKLNRTIEDLKVSNAAALKAEEAAVTGRKEAQKKQRVIEDLKVRHAEEIQEREATIRRLKEEGAEVKRQIKDVRSMSPDLDQKLVTTAKSIVALSDRLETLGVDAGSKEVVIATNAITRLIGRFHEQDKRLNIPELQEPGA